MTYRPRAACKWCGIPRADAGGLSRSGACGPCGEARLADNHRAMKSQQGPAWDRWVLSMADMTYRLGGGLLLPPGVDMRSLENTRTVSRR